jgi:class 3 adenylate cyclase/tetratricopeptide (TPR) repeat protein
MKCHSCGFENPALAASCGECGATLLMLSLAADEPLAPADLDHLRHYLPPALMQALRAERVAPPPRLVEQCVQSLDQLLDATGRHLPNYLVDTVLQAQVPGRTGGRFLHGTLLFADISGFTTISERLARIGQEGAEEITVIINRYFTVMLGLLQHHGGQLLTFGGDALLSLFLDPADGPGLSAAWAAGAALQMQAAMAEFSQTATTQGTFPLTMKVSLRSGRFFAAQLGTAQQMVHALFGTDVNAVAAGEKLASAGYVVMDEGTFARLPAPCAAVPVSAGFVRLEHLAAPRVPPPAPPVLVPEPAEAGRAQLRHKLARLDALTPYLSAGILPRLTGDTDNLPLEGEHRLVATLFANIRGLDEITDYTESEEAITAALNHYFVTMQAAVQQYGGVINKIDLSDHGNKLLAFFGAPVAHEDDAERAVRAALEMQAALRRESLAPDAAHLRLTLAQHIGLSYGHVFAGYVGATWRHEYTVMGDNVNLAARLMTTAEDGQVVVNENVQRAVKALFDLEARGAVNLKGKSEPVPIFLVQGLRTTPDSVRGLEGLRAPLIGRDAEWAQLLSALEAARAGQGRIVRVMGEAGLGKSRLVAEWRQHFANPQRWLEARCLSYTESISYYPLQELVRQMLDIRPDDTLAASWRKLQAACRHPLAPLALQEALPYLVDFLGLPLPAELRERVFYLDAEALQKRIFVSVRALFEVYVTPDSRLGPLVICLDDVHWIDQASSLLLENLLSLTDRLPLLVVLIYRPESESMGWRLHEKVSRTFVPVTLDLTLQGLSPADSQALLTHLVNLEDWPEDLRSLILSRSEGNPLYLEEMLRVLIEAGSLVREADGTWRAHTLPTAQVVPTTLHGLLMTRLDRLEEAPRRTAQVASIAGRTAPWDVLAQLTADPAPRLNANLAHLEQHEILRQTQRKTEITYAFRHALMQSVCYESLPARLRRAHHSALAEYLEKQLASAPQSETLYPLIAYHAFAGQGWERALRYLLLAGQQAQSRCANLEACEYFKKALHCISQAPAIGTPESLRVIQAALGELLTTSGDYEQAQAHLRAALALAEAGADPSAEAHACRWLARLFELQGQYPKAFEWIERGLAGLQGKATPEAVQLRITAGLIHTRQGDYDHALENVQSALQMAESLGELTALARANNMLGLIALNRGDSRLASEHFQHGLKLYSQAGDLHGQAMSHNLMASAYFNAGQLSLADEHYRQAHSIFNQAGDIYNRAFADNNLGEIALNQGQLDQALGYYQAALRSFEKLGASAYVLGAVQMNLGAVLIWRKELASAALARQHLLAGLALFDQAQARDFLPELHRHLAEAALVAHDLAEAEAQGRLALSLAEELAMRGEAGCARRVLGEVALAQGQASAAETQLLESVAILAEVADECQLARSRLVLARVWGVCGQTAQARALVDQSQAVFEQLGAALDLAAASALRASLAEA